MNIDDINEQTSFGDFVDFCKNNEFDEILYDSSVCELVSTGWTDKHRWQTFTQEIYKHIQSGRFFSVIQCKGNTESQEGENAEFENEVVPPEVITIKYKAI